MKTRSIFYVVFPCALLLASCPMPTVSTHEAPAPAVPQNAYSGFAVETDAARNQGVFIDEKGVRIDIQSAEEDGSVVGCAEAVSVAAVAADGQPAAKSLGGRKAALVIGRRADGKPGAWIVNPDYTIESLVTEDSGKHTSCLPESDEMNGYFRGRFGWAYTVMGISENSKVIVGFATCKREFTWDGGKIDQGTTIGVYWRVWKPAGGRFFVASRARIIGVLDPSNVPHQDRRHRRWIDWLSAHSFERLKWFLLDYLTSYLTMVEKNGVTYNETKGVYEIRGSDQDKHSAIATIDKDWKIAIEPVITGQGRYDLRPGSMSFVGDAVAGGQSLPVILPIENLQPDTVTDSFEVHFFLATSSVFSPSDDTDLGAVTVAADVPGNSSVTINATLPRPIPTGINEVCYVYAVVDSTGVVTESNKTNNQSTTDTAAAVLVYDPAISGRTYAIVLQTYLGSDPSKTTGSTDTVMALYRDNSPTATYLPPADTSGASDFSLIDKTSSPLAPGTYYVVVESYSGRNGPYALSVRTLNISSSDLPRFVDMTSNSQDTWEPDDTPTVVPITASTTIPTKPDPVKVGSALNRYSALNDWDWFTFVLP